MFLIYWQNLLFHLAQSVQKSDQWLYPDLLYSCMLLFPGFRVVCRWISLPFVFTQVFQAFDPCFLASVRSHKQKIMKASLSRDSTEFPVVCYQQASFHLASDLSVHIYSGYSPYAVSTLFLQQHSSYSKIARVFQVLLQLPSLPQ